MPGTTVRDVDVSSANNHIQTDTRPTARGKDEATPGADLREESRNKD